jgi:sulfur-carrier protein
MSEPITDVMPLEILYFGLIRNVVGIAGETVTLPERTSVRGLLNILSQKYGERFRDVLFTSEGTLPANAIILLDGKNILHGNGLDTEIPPAGSAHILVTMTAIGGG